jgi:DNA-binding transcriptional regulator WhiA
MKETENNEWKVTGETLIKNEKTPEIDIIRKRHHNQKYDINFSIFEDANTEEFAYFLGFFYADGYNNEKSGHINISLKYKDLEILEKFSKLFFGNRPIRISSVRCQTNKDNKICSLSIGNRELTKILSNYGAPQKKTFKIRFPFWLNKNLQRHFIRGYFDGDGSIMKNKNNHSLNLVGNLEFNTELKSVIKDLINLDFGLIKQDKVTLLYKGGNRNTQKFLDWLYEDCKLFLVRKYNRYKGLLVERNRVKNLYSYVYYSPKNNKWISRLSSKHNRKWIGQYNTKEEAIYAYNSHPLAIHYS